MADIDDDLPHTDKCPDCRRYRQLRQEARRA